MGETESRNPLPGMLEIQVHEQVSEEANKRNHELWVEVASLVDRVCFCVLGLTLLLSTLILLVIMPMFG